MFSRILRVIYKNLAETQTHPIAINPTCRIFGNLSISMNRAKIGVINLERSRLVKMISPCSLRQEGRKEMKSRGSVTDSLQGDIAGRRAAKERRGGFGR